MSSVVVADTVERTVTRLARLSPDLTRWNGKIVGMGTEAVGVGASVFRKFTCIRGCRSCCLFQLTLDYIPQEFDNLTWDIPRTLFYPRFVDVNSQKFEIHTLTDKFRSLEDPCPLMKTVSDGNPGCTVWPNNPLECHAAPIVHIRLRESSNLTSISKQLFARAWRYPEKTQCDFTKTFDSSDLDELIGIFERYLMWAEYLKIRTMIPELLREFTYMKSGLVPVGPFSEVWRG